MPSVYHVVRNRRGRKSFPTQRHQDYAALRRSLESINHIDASKSPQSQEGAAPALGFPHVLPFPPSVRPPLCRSPVIPTIHTPWLLPGIGSTDRNPLPDWLQAPKGATEDIGIEPIEVPGSHFGSNTSSVNAGSWGSPLSPGRRTPSLAQQPLSIGLPFSISTSTSVLPTLSNTSSFKSTPSRSPTLLHDTPEESSVQIVLGHLIGDLTAAQARSHSTSPPDVCRLSPDRQPQNTQQPRECSHGGSYHHVGSIPAPKSTPAVRPDPPPRICSARAGGLVSAVALSVPREFVRGNGASAGPTAWTNDIPLTAFASWGPMESGTVEDSRADFDTGEITRGQLDDAEGGGELAPTLGAGAGRRRQRKGTNSCFLKGNPSKGVSPIMPHFRLA